VLRRASKSTWNENRLRPVQTRAYVVAGG